MLYFVPTPIGNLEDITLRALRILGEVDIIYAEDTRHTLKLLNHYEIKKTLVSYHKYNEIERCGKIAAEVNSGKKIALVSDAGFPGISDPGAILAKYFSDHNIAFTVLPGANAALPALVLSGLDCDRFYFEGFLPREKKEQSERLSTVATIDSTLIFYENPNRVKNTLKTMLEVFGNRNCSVCREISKIYETVYRGDISSIIDDLPEKMLGECVIIVEGHTASFELDINAILKNMSALISGGMKVKDAAKSLANPVYSANELFRLYLDKS